MKKFVKIGLLLVAMTALLSSCNPLKKMNKNQSKIEVVMNPQNLEVRGGKIATEITVTFPKKYFYEDVTMKLTPVLVYPGGEVAAADKYVQGQDVKDNFDVIYWKTGGSYTQKIEFPYKAGMENGKLELRVNTKEADKCAKNRCTFLTTTDPATGAVTETPRSIISLSNGVANTGVINQFDDPRSTGIIADDMANTRKMSDEAVLHFAVNKADVDKKELSSDDITAFINYVKSVSADNEAIMNNVAANGFASPEGPTKYNQDLSVKRANSGNAALSNLLSGSDVAFDITPNGADWNGFRQLVAASDIQDKDLILQVLDMYSSSDKRNAELKNMTEVFTELKTKILPQLRRAQMVANSEKKIKSDADLKTLALAKDASLDVEELLYAANTQITNLNDKATVYQFAADKFNDARAYNNLGATLLKLGKFADAEKALNQASKLSTDPAVTTNLYALAVAKGDTKKAQELYAGLNGGAKQYYDGFQAFQSGNYDAASATLSGYQKAVTEVMNQNYDAAKSSLQGDASAQADYLRAVIAARQGDVTGAVANLKSSIATDPTMKAKAAADAEFIKLRELPAVQSILK